MRFPIKLVTFILVLVFWSECLTKSPLHGEGPPGVMLVPLFSPWISQAVARFAVVPWFFVM
jgi:hypothetical protein